MESNCLPAIAESLPCLLDDRFVASLVKTRPLSQCNTCVIIPVRDEADTLESTLFALVHQVDLCGRPLDPNSYEVIVLANNCSDNSAAIARQFAAQYPKFVLHVVEMVLPPAQAYIGRVRQLLMDEAYHRLIGAGRHRGVIASTDGDTRVEPTWIAATLEEIQRGADAVSGRLLTDRDDRALLDAHTRACYLRAVGYGYLSVELEAYIDPDPFDCLPRHHQHGGASLAVTAEMYAIAGGMPSVRTPEDVAFYQALVQVGARFCHSSRVRVFTSMRRQGRTNNGMANQLSQWTNSGQKHQPHLVESAAALETRLWGRRKLRELWSFTLNGFPPKTQEIRAIASLLHISPLWLSQAMVDSDSFTKLFALIEQQQVQEGNWQKAWKPVEIKRAIADLRLRVSRLRQEQKSKLTMVTYPAKVIGSDLLPLAKSSG